MTTDLPVQTGCGPSRLNERRLLCTDMSAGVPDHTSLYNRIQELVAASKRLHLFLSPQQKAWLETKAAAIPPSDSGRFLCLCSYRKCVEATSRAVNCLDAAEPAPTDTWVALATIQRHWSVQESSGTRAQKAAAKRVRAASDASRRCLSKDLFLNVLDALLHETLAQPPVPDRQNGVERTSGQPESEQQADLGSAEPLYPPDLEQSDLDEPSLDPLPPLRYTEHGSVGEFHRWADCLKDGSYAQRLAALKPLQPGCDGSKVIRTQLPPEQQRALEGDGKSSSTFGAVLMMNSICIYIRQSAEDIA